MSEERNRVAEWTAFAVSFVIVLAVLGVIAWLHTRTAPQPPTFSVTTTQVRRVADEFFVHASVYNHSDQTVESVQVVADLAVDGKTVAEGEQVLMFLAGSERQEVVFVFPQDPDKGTLDVRVASYRLP